jgi:hypothetical protein
MMSVPGVDQVDARSVEVATLTMLRGHESMTTSQRYVSGAGTENRAAAARNPLYELIEQPTSDK